MRWDVILIKTQTNTDARKEIAESVPVARMDFVNGVRVISPEPDITKLLRMAFFSLISRPLGS